jgi:hypothetical protein
MSRHLHLIRPILAAGAAAALVTATFAAPGFARTAPQRAASGPTTVASGLDSPRLLSFGPGGTLLVAEAGTGATGTGDTSRCVTGGEGDQSCLGLTGAITAVWHGHQARVVTGLPSLAGSGGDSAIGPSGVRWERGRLLVSVGAGIDADQRATLGRDARLLGTLVSLHGGRHHHHNGGHHRHGLHARILADIARYELRHNPDGSTAHDSDPTGFVAGRTGNFLTDSGGNDLLFIDRHGRVHLIAVFPDRMVPFPPEAGGGEGPMQAVPTAVDWGPDGALYVSQLTGFPFPVGAANIWRIEPGHAPTVWASGLTNVTDLAWHHGQLYAVQIADGGLLSAEGGSTPPMGSLLRVHAGDNSTPDAVSSGLPAPYGVAFHHDAAYVTTCSVCPGQGAVMRIPLH